MINENPKCPICGNGPMFEFVEKIMDNDTVTTYRPSLLCDHCGMRFSMDDFVEADIEDDMDACFEPLLSAIVKKGR